MKVMQWINQDIYIMLGILFLSSALVESACLIFLICVDYPVTLIMYVAIIIKLMTGLFWFKMNKTFKKVAIK